VGEAVGLLPILNEVGTVRLVIDGLLSSGAVDRLLVVDDGSTDGTLDELRRAQVRWPQLDLELRPDQKGLGSALLHGFREAIRRYPFDRLVVLDGDLSHDPAAIPDLLASSHDLVIGSRYVRDGRIENWNASRRLISFIANSVARRLLRLPVRDVTSGFRVYSRPLVEMILDHAACGGYEFQVETIWLAALHRYSIGEVPIAFIERKAGESKLATPEEAWKFTRFVMSKAFIHRRSKRLGVTSPRAGRSS
jgi:dolichol-phosphate mannosyltransferase